MYKWNSLTSNDYFNLKLSDRVKFYTDTLIVQPIDVFQTPIFLKHNYNGLIEILLDGITNRKSTQQISSNLGHFTKVWDVDWYWIVHHLTLDYCNYIEAKYIEKNRGSDAIVFKQVSKNDCIYCKQLYLKEITTDEPKTFTLSQLIKNGHNLTFNIKEFRPVIGATIFGYDEKAESYHWDFSNLYAVLPDFVWSNKKKKFIPNPNRKNKYNFKGLVKIKNK